MSAFESSYKSQLQGVTQQVARERLDGQVSAQENMLSDPVTNVRRRPGALYAYSMQMVGGDSDHLLAWETDLQGKRVQILLNTNSGRVTILDKNYVTVGSFADTYLMTNDVGTIQTAAVAGEFFLLNTNITPGYGPSLPSRDPATQGFAYVRAGAFSKTYDIRIESSRGAYTYTYTTPDGSKVGDAGLATSDYIMGQLVNLVTAATASHGVTGVRDTSFAYFTAEAGVTVSIGTGSGSAYMVTSSKSYVPQESDLPTRLPSTADGMIMSVGPLKALRYYTYQASSLTWLECGEWQSPSYLIGCPVSIVQNGDTWALNKENFEGRLAGDNLTNPPPDFLANGITGMSTFQGRLVLLAGAMVNMSASNKPRRFYRSTTTALLDSDCISIGASAATAASFRYAIPFAKDLLLFSESYQALIPGGSTAITPRNASVVVTSSYTADMSSSPLRAGQSLLYPVPRSRNFFGVMEMLPSSAVNNQYDSTDSTAHLPKYMAGRCRGSVANSGSNMVLFMPSNDRKALLVQEYQWVGAEKKQQAWHKWTFPYPVASAYFSNQVIHVVFVNNGYLVACTIDPRAGTSNRDGDTLPFMDMCSFREVSNNLVANTDWVQQFDPTVWPSIRLAVASGPLAGESVGCTPEGQSLRTVPSFPDGRVAAGLPYTSLLSPTPPMRKDYQGVVITSDKMTLLRFMVSTNNSAEYTASVGDAGMGDSSYEVPTLYYSSKELELGQARNGADSTATVPARTNAATTSFVLKTSGMGELNIVGIEYVARTHNKIRRK